uniref:Uncharacterized protein n=1 Tax=Salix viminalis TaxID=40686 RepID=A0A6N2N9S2_SALVM
MRFCNCFHLPKLALPHPALQGSQNQACKSCQVLHQLLRIVTGTAVTIISALSFKVITALFLPDTLSTFTSFSGEYQVEREPSGMTRSCPS